MSVLEKDFIAGCSGTSIEQAFAELRHVCGEIGNPAGIYQLGNIVLDYVDSMNRLPQPFVLEVTKLWGRLTDVCNGYIYSCADQMPVQVDRIRMAAVKYLAAWVDPTGELVRTTMSKDGQNIFDNPAMWELALARVMQESQRQRTSAPVPAV